MKFKIESTQALGRRLGYIGAAGQISERAVADLLRAALARWGLSPKSKLLHYAREELRIAGLDEEVERVAKIADALGELGDCAELEVEGEAQLSPTPPRWLRVGENQAALLGSAQPPEGAEPPLISSSDLVRRVALTDKTEAALEAAGLRGAEFSAWAAPPGYHRHLRRRLGGEAVLIDGGSLPRLWKQLEELCEAEGGPVADDESKLRCVAGAPGEYFPGRASKGGRWRDPAHVGDGTYCAIRAGYNEQHVHPCLLLKQGGQLRLADLWDFDEWRWALLARGQALSAPEQVSIERGDGVTCARLSFPPPAQLRAAMQLLGPPCGPRKWQLAPGHPRPWELFGAVTA